MNNNLIDRYKDIVNDIKNKFNYDNNITHLLYIIIPAFVYKYKYKEKMIINIFNDIEIFINNEYSKYVKAFYTSIPKYINNNVITDKYIVINNYDKISLVNLLDSLIHEFNHAINSYNNEIKIDNNILYLRTGLTYISYNIPTLKSIGKDNSYILEEIINTKQTEEIIDIIKNYKDSDDEIISNIIYSLNNETDTKYESKAYYLEMKILDKLINNKTFISTLENLRLTGNIEDINYWFNNITGIDNSYNTIINKLDEIMKLEIKLENTKYFKNRIISHVRSKIKDIDYIISIFNKNCNYR